MASSAENKSLYVGNLTLKCTEATLYDKFSSIGSILSIKICRDTEGKSLGYAYVNFTKPEEAETALKTLNHEIIDGKPLRIMWAQKDVKSKLLRSANLVVKNLDKNLDDKLLMDMFSVFGKILSVKVATNQNGMSKGYGFVQFENEESAEKAISSFDGKTHNGKKLALNRFIPAEERQKSHQVKYSNNVFVKNLAKSVTNDDFEKLCECFGDIMSAKVVTDEDNESKGYGFVSFSSDDSAVRAVEQLNRLCLNGKVLSASIADARSPNSKA